MSAITLLVVGVVIGVGDLLLGLWFVGLSARNPDQLPASFQGSPPEKLKGLGRVLMIGGPLIFLVLASFAFGLIPAESIAPIRFQ